MDYVYPTFVFRERHPPQKESILIEMARGLEAELRYWGVEGAHLYVFKVPGTLAPELDERLVSYFQDPSKGFQSMDMGYLTGLELEGLFHEVLYRPERS